MVGILCAHGLKVLDLMNIKMLPTHYILKRWTREALLGSIQDRHGRNVIENPKLEAQLRFKSLSHKFHNLAYKATDSLECCLLLDNALDCLCTQVEDKLNLSSCAMDEKPTNEEENVDPNVNQRDDLLSAAKLKKKEVQSKNSKRKRTWIDKLRHKGKHKQAKSSIPPKSAKPKKKGTKVCCKLANLHNA